MRFGKMGLLVAAVAAIGFVGANSASAATVEVDYNTAGLFSGAGSAPAGVTYNIFNTATTTDLRITKAAGPGAGTIDLIFTNELPNIIHPSIGNPTTTPLGLFTVNLSTGADISGLTGSLANFTLTINQGPNPTGGNGSSGGITSTQVGAEISVGQGGFMVQFVPTTIQINPVTYAIDNLDTTQEFNISVPGSNGGGTANTTLNADVTVAPLPEAAAMGLSMLGGLGGLRIMRRRLLGR